VKQEVVGFQEVTPSSQTKPSWAIAHPQIMKTEQVKNLFSEQSSGTVRQGTP